MALKFRKYPRSTQHTCPLLEVFSFLREMQRQFWFWKYCSREVAVVAHVEPGFRNVSVLQGLKQPGSWVRFVCGAYRAVHDAKKSNGCRDRAATRDVLFQCGVYGGDEGWTRCWGIVVLCDGKLDVKCSRSAMCMLLCNLTFTPRGF